MTASLVGTTLSIDRWDDTSERAVAAGGYELLQLISGTETWVDLRFLAPYSAVVRHLRVSWLLRSCKGLDLLTELCSLNLGDRPPTPIRSLASLKCLRSCKMGWAKRIDGRAFFALPELREVSLLGYSADDCSDIGLATNLNSLTLRHSRLRSLVGIASCKDLQCLDGVERCARLRILDVQRGSPLAGVADTLSKLGGLEEVYLEGDFEVEHMRWLGQNPRMTSLRSDAVVTNIDWVNVFESPMLREVAFRYQPGVLQGNREILDAGTSLGRPLKWIERGGTRKRPWVELHFAN